MYCSDRWQLLRSQHAMGNDVVSEPSTLPGRFRTLFIALWQANVSNQFNIVSIFPMCFNLWNTRVPVQSNSFACMTSHRRTQECWRVLVLVHRSAEEMHFVCKQRRQLPAYQCISIFRSCAQCALIAPPAGSRFDV